jgi:glycosyltransferase involved in cell wall biosynthesis
MKLLWLSHFIPYPPRGGSRQRSFNLIRQVSTKYETHLIALNMQGETKERAAEYAAELGKHCARVEIWPPPYPWRGARWWAQLAFSPFYRHHYGACALWSPQLGRRWQAVLARHAGALVHFDSIDLALYFPPVRQMAGFRKVLNHHNCESAMAARRAAKEPNPLKKVYLWDQARKLRRLEARLCHEFDVNLAVSALDAATLQAIAPCAHFHVVENGTDTEYFHPSSEPPEPSTLVFVGSLDWYPNLAGLNFLLQKVWPAVKNQRPGARLHLAGREPPPWLIHRAACDPQITLVPNPEDVRPWIHHAAVFACPVLDGGGTRLKILDALAMGKAVVSTTIGCEGLRLTPGEHVLIADTAQDFAALVLGLMADEELRNALGFRGRAQVERFYNWQVIAASLDAAYQLHASGSEHGEIR